MLFRLLVEQRASLHIKKQLEFEAIKTPAYLKKTPWSNAQLELHLALLLLGNVLEHPTLGLQNVTCRW